MENKIICPICHKENDADAEQCAYCGQRFRPYNVTNVDFKKHQRHKKLKYESVKSIIFIIFFAAFFIYTFLTNNKQQVISAVSMIIPQKAVSVKDISVYVNQNEKCYLPSQVPAEMNYGGSKAVNIKWDSSNADCSQAGTEIIKGKVEGYSRTVNYKITVLPHEIRTSVGDCTVDNSMAEYNIKLDNNTKWLWFQIFKGGKYLYEFFPVDNGQVKCKLYLPFGPGDYDITASTSTNKLQESVYHLWKRFHMENKDKRDMDLLPDINVQCDSSEIIKLAYIITKDCYSDMDKTRAIHDWVAENIAYDIDEYNTGKVHEYSAVETFEERKAVCNGYANLTAALNRAIGIKTKIIVGTAKNSPIEKASKNNSHAWNETCIEGKWIIQDTTWDAGYVDSHTHSFKFSLSHKYFNPSPAFFSLTHTKEGEK